VLVHTTFCLSGLVLDIFDSCPLLIDDDFHDQALGWLARRQHRDVWWVAGGSRRLVCRMIYGLNRGFMWGWGGGVPCWIWFHSQFVSQSSWRHTISGRCQERSSDSHAQTSFKPLSNSDLSKISPLHASGVWNQIHMLYPLTQNLDLECFLKTKKILWIIIQITAPLQSHRLFTIDSRDAKLIFH